MLKSTNTRFQIRDVDFHDSKKFFRFFLKKCCNIKVVGFTLLMVQNNIFHFLWWHFFINFQEFFITTFEFVRNRSGELATSDFAFGLGGGELENQKVSSWKWCATGFIPKIDKEVTVTNTLTPHKFRSHRACASFLTFQPKFFCESVASVRLWLRRELGTGRNQPRSSPVG